MGLFQRNIFADDTPLYEIVTPQSREAGQDFIDRTLLVVGLGNPGKKYRATRHNFGSSAIDDFASANEFEAWKTKKDLSCEITIKVMGSTKVILIKPTTFMNESGRAIKAVQKFYKLTNSDTCVVYDDIDIPFGQIRTRKGGGPAGHNGIKSLISHCGEDFFRIRLGIGSEIAKKSKSEDFVLKNFSKKESESLPAIYAETKDIIQGFLDLGSLIPETRTI